MHITRREILIEEFLKPRGICVTKFAVDTGLTLRDVDFMDDVSAQIISAYTGKSVDFWQKSHLDSKSYDRALVKLFEILNSPPGLKDFEEAKLLMEQIERYERTEFPS